MANERKAGDTTITEEYKEKVSGKMEMLYSDIIDLRSRISKLENELSNLKAKLNVNYVEIAPDNDESIDFEDIGRKVVGKIVEIAKVYEEYEHGTRDKIEGVERQETTDWINSIVDGAVINGSCLDIYVSVRPVKCS